ncbi:MAG: hypothetical protein GVY32_02240 [Gammaproteobacteria bacterium]|jgi:hypothetical protein|nr:hypothetical protein [Gammaproteobacteria bacterium]
MPKRSLLSLAVGSVATLFASSALAFDLDLIDTSVADPEQTVIDALVGPGSNITVVPGSVQFIGRTGDGNEAQSALFSNFSLTGAGQTITIDNGVLLTSGVANLPASNTVNQWDHGAASVSAPGTGSSAELSTLSGTSTNDQNVISFEFTLDNPADTGIAMDLVFGSDEFPTQSVTDIFGFFVDGVNFAEFPSGQLIGNNDDTQFLDNPVGGSDFAIEYNGITPRFTIIGTVDGSLSTHTAIIAIADTNDAIFDSGAFVANIRGTEEEGGIGGPPPGPGPATPAFSVPVNGPVGMLVLLLTLMATGLVILRNRS